MMKEGFHIAVVRSGGQTGADRGALDAARGAGVPIRGWCPLGGWAEDMPAPPGLLATYPELAEAPSREPIVRTEWNVRDSDATLIVCAEPIDRRSGTAATIEFARRLGKPHFISNGSDCAHVVAWLSALAPERDEGLDLNVAGPRESGSPGTYELARRLIAQLIAQDKTGDSPPSYRPPSYPGTNE